MTEVYPCGTQVTSKLSNIDGIITAISIRFSNVSYEIGYFSGHEYKQIWLYECEFVTSVTKDKIGFKTISNQ